MDGSNCHTGYPAQPPKKRRSGTDFDERDVKPDVNHLNARLIVSTPPESGNSQSQDLPLDFSVKNGSDSVSPPSVISPPSTISPLSARSSPSARSPPLAVSPISTHFSASDSERARKGMPVRMPLTDRDQGMDYSDSSSRQAPEYINPSRPKISVVNPTVHMHTEEDANGSKENGVENSPLANFSTFMERRPQNSYDVPVNARPFENGFGNSAKEFGSRAKNYESVVNGFSRPNDGLCSANMTTFNPYLGMLNASLGAGLMTAQGGILNGQGGVLNGPGGLLSGQGGLLNGQGGILNTQGGLLNSQTFKYGTAETNGDRKLSKSARPFKIYEHEILNYPYQNCSPLIPTRFQEIPQPSSTAYNPAISPRNESPPDQQSHIVQSNGDPQREVSDDFSDESQHSNNPQQGYDGNSSRRKGQKYPDEKKDAAYFEKRRKNNLAAKRSRDARRLKEDAIATRARNLVQENTLLRMRMTEYQAINMRLEAELNGFKRAAYDQRSEIDKLKDEVERLNRGFAYNNSSRNRSESPGL